MINFSRLGWMAAPALDSGLHVLESDRSWSFVSYADLYRDIRKVASRILDAKPSSTSIICVLVASPREFVGALYGGWLSGHPVSALTPPAIFDNELRYQKYLDYVIQKTLPEIIVVDHENNDIVEASLARCHHHAKVLLVPCDGYEEVIARSKSDLALVQFTSGSTGHPRAVAISDENLNSNVRGIIDWLGITDEDSTATWLPLYHDMGLVGCLITPISCGIDIWMMRPEQFVRYPGEWINCFGDGRATLTAAPNFGYGYAAKRIRMNPVSEGADFSRWRVAIVGAERVRGETLKELARVLSPQGFKESAFLPAYGMAEATLFVTGHSRGVSATTVQLDLEKLSFGSRVEVLNCSTISDLESGYGPGWLVGSGLPQLGTEIMIVGENGEQLAPGVLGEVLIRGHGVSPGYWKEGASEGPTRITADGLFSGDAGFIYNNDLFVIGRMGDSIKIRGRAVYVEDLESHLFNATKVPPGRCCVVARSNGHKDVIIVIAEDVPPDWGATAAEVLRPITGDTVEIHFCCGERGTIQRTSSGKPRRREMWNLVSTGVLHTTVVLRS